MYQVYQLRVNVNVTLNLLSPGLERKAKCYNGYVVSKYMFHIEEYGHDKRHITMEFVLRD